MAVNREIVESPMLQGVDEIIAYTLTTTPWGSDPSDTSVVVFDITGGGRDDVTSTVMPTNTPSESGDIITLSPLKLLTDKKGYRVEVKFTISGNVFEAFAVITAEQ